MILKSVKLFSFGLILLVFSAFSTGCANKSYPCPGLGQSDAADLSMFDENGQLKNGKKKRKGGRIDKTTGMVNKKSPKKIRKPRRTKI